MLDAKTPSTPIHDNTKSAASSVLNLNTPTVRNNSYSTPVH